MESLNKASGTLLEKNWYILDHADEITEAIAEKLDIDLSRKYLTLGEIKNFWQTQKRPDSTTTFCCYPSPHRR